jgi:lipoyl(octanoyl) transferase
VFILDESKLIYEYKDSIAKMNYHLENAIKDENYNVIWLFQNKDVYTIGRSGSIDDVINNENNIPIEQSSRGGKVTYHGPGQLMIYFILHISIFNNDINNFVRFIENIIIKGLKEFGINSFTKDGLVGIWSSKNGKDVKIASIGLRVKNGVTIHGTSINIENDLSHFKSIIPCGIKNYEISSINDIDNKIKYSMVTDILYKLLSDYFINGFKRCNNDR